MAYTKIEIYAQLSFASQPQYLPHDMLAHTAPKKVPIVTNVKPIYIKNSFISVSSLMIEDEFFLKLITRVYVPIIAQIPKNP